jgi:hypothetical protein
MYLGFNVQFHNFPGAAKEAKILREKLLNAAKVLHHTMDSESDVIVTLDESAGMENPCCETNKVFAPFQFETHPPQTPWICGKCGTEGTSTEAQPSPSYERIKAKFKKPGIPELDKSDNTINCQN